MLAWEAAYKLLGRLDPEAAHHAACRALALAGKFPPAMNWLKARYASPDKPVEFMGIRFPNAVGLAAGFDKEARLVEVLPCMGFGFLELGTFTWHPQPGNPRPRVWRVVEARAIVNRMGFPNPGARVAARRLARIQHKPHVPLGLNIGKSSIVPLDEAPADYLRSMETLHPYADYFAFNISSPNTPELRKLHEPERLKALLGTAREWMEARQARKPLFLKISPELEEPELESVVAACARWRFGVIATNTTLHRDGLPGWAKDLPGGVSGAPLKARSLGKIRRLRELGGPGLPLIGVGGIMEPQDAKDYIQAGADLVQLYTGLVYNGPRFAQKCVEAIAS